MIKRFRIILIICLLLSAVKLFSQTDEYWVKGVFIEKITRFIEWPQGSKVNDVNKKFVISVIGDNPFAKKLNEIYKDTKIKNKQVELRYINRISEIDGSDVLFICSNEKDMLTDILAFTKDKLILTLADSEGFGEGGVLINFFIIDNKIKFEINETAVKAAGLMPSYMLLNLAKVVNPMKKYRR